MRPYLVVYTVVALAVVVALLVPVPLLYTVTKPLIMITLGVGYWFASPNRSITVLVAIALSWLGDVLLMFTGEIYFMGGLASFLVSHLFYIIAYRQHRFEGDGLSGVQKIRFSFPFILATTGLLAVLYPHLGALMVPVTLYAITITVMMMQAIFRYGHTNSSSYWLVFTGAFLFVISDSALAINKFMGGFAYAGMVVMTTYMAAQVLIVMGLSRHNG